MNSTGEILKYKTLNRQTVNSNINISSTVNSSTDGIYIDGNDFENDAMAQELSDKLDDQKSLAYFRILAKETNHQILREVLAYVLETARAGQIKKTKARYFMFLLKVRKIRTKFKREEDEKVTK